jgi:hypothetical protein
MASGSRGREIPASTQVLVSIDRAPAGEPVVTLRNERIAADQYT